jgi:predicted site-specific integrase-resolvase
MLTMVTVFTGRLYGHRAKGVRKRVETMLKECEQEEQINGTGQQNDQTPP